MNYYELRAQVAAIVPRMTQLWDKKKHEAAVQEKGRKSNYKEYKLQEQKWVKQERLLNLEEINSFVEVSCRAHACPMPLNLDVWDGLLCVAEGQLVTTFRGPILIENIQRGDLVLTLNETTKELEYKQVIQISKNIRKDMIEIQSSKGVLKVTADHPIYTQRGWVDAGDLKENDLIATFKAK